MEVKTYEAIDDLPEDVNLEFIVDFSQVEKIVRDRYKELTGKEFEFRVRISDPDKFEQIPYIKQQIRRVGARPDGICSILINIIDLHYHNPMYSLYIIGHEIGHLEEHDKDLFGRNGFHDDVKAIAFGEAFIMPTEQYYTNLGYDVKSFLDFRFNGDPAYKYVRSRMASGTDTMELFNEVRTCLGYDCEHVPLGN
ncbi:MAG: hypothetical protein IH934_05165 [Nanoarchaeota archaeon]|nr:hypothetical protein [Nanoarchaeota archaeon]